MRFLKFKLFRKKESEKENCLYKNTSNLEFLQYDENHHKENYSIEEKNRIKSVYKDYIFGQNTSTCVSIIRKIFGQPVEFFFIIEKYSDEWFLAHSCRLSDTRNFDVINHYLCDSIDGVIQLLKKR